MERRGVSTRGFPPVVDDDVMEQEERVRKSREIYAQAGDEYERLLFNPENGGFVLVHQGHNRGDSYESELFVARALTNQGRRVTLLNETGMGAGVKTPDADIDGSLAEFKRVTQITENVTARVQEGFTGAKKQGANLVIFHLDREQLDTNLVNRGIAQAVIFDGKQKIKMVIVVFRDGTINAINREEWNNGQRFS